MRAAASSRSSPSGSISGSRLSTTAVVAGAGAAGIFSALALQNLGVDVTLVDPFGPGHPRAASCGDHRILRCSHGADELYTAWARTARIKWLELSQDVGESLFVECGFMALASDRDDRWEAASVELLSRLGIPHTLIPPDELALRFPMMNLDGIAYGLWEPESGFISSRLAILAATRLFINRGGKVLRARLETDHEERPTLDGREIASDIIVCACGAWMRNLFPRTLGPMLEVLRQDVILVAPPPASKMYDSTHFPAFMDRGYPAYGIPALEGLGFKAVIVWNALSLDLEDDDRLVSPATVARSRRYLATRFPELASRPIVGQEVGQFAQTTDSHFIVAAHPEHGKVLLVTGDSGHLFKHGPVLGEHVADLAFGRVEPEARFRIGRRASLARSSSPQ